MMSDSTNHNNDCIFHLSSISNGARAKINEPISVNFILIVFIIYLLYFFTKENTPLSGLQGLRPTSVNQMYFTTFRQKFKFWEKMKISLC